MDEIAEKLSGWFGSTPFIIVHIAWFLAWYPLGGSTDTLTLVVSLEAIFLSLFILRAEKVQGARMEQALKTTKKDTRKDLKKSDKVIRMMKDKK